jgi:hydroxymethylpyrimidine/phosphomethylpyrimidine kinase
MIYTANYENAVRFYRDLLGFKMIDEYPGGYGRLQSPGGRTTIALHMVEPGQHLDTAREGVRLYFEIPKLDAFCQSLMSQGVTFEHPPKDMPWGWRHAYLRDPDGHELSFYWAGAKRFRKTTMGDEPR